MFGTKHSLHRSVKDAKGFYAAYSAIILIAAGIVVIPHAPLGLITTAVQALAGILLPSATVFLLILCNDRAVLGPWVNRPWLNVVSSVIVGVLVMLSLILAVTTFFPNVNVNQLSMAAGRSISCSASRFGGRVVVAAEDRDRHCLFGRGPLCVENAASG